jgi:hypothetical protein
VGILFEISELELPLPVFILVGVSSLGTVVSSFTLTLTPAEIGSLASPPFVETGIEDS